MVNRSTSRRLALAAMLAAVAPAHAQYPVGAVVQPLAGADDPGTRLAAALRTLSTNPTDLGALAAAGRNSLLLGDANAAAGFFGRADQINPRDGRVKAGLGAALVQLERPADALRLFAQAASLGVPAGDFAADRGLAYDLTGDPQAAQRDYRTVLAGRPDDDVARRRLALSQGIAGDRKGAIATLDPLIRRSDLAAWRAQTFVLAMTGDPAGANAITRVMMPQQEAALQPFLVRLAALGPADKARAVHFGEMPTSGMPATRIASAAPAPLPAPGPVTRPSDLAPATSLPAPTLAARSPVPVVAGVPVDRRAAAPAPAPIASPTSVAPQTVAPIASAQVAAPARAEEPLAALTPRNARADLTTAFRDPLRPRVVVATASPAPSSATPPTAIVTPTTMPPVAATTPATAMPSPIAPAPPIATTALPPSNVAASPVAAPVQSAALPPLPQGSNAGVGHYDLPHAAIVRPARAPAPVVRTPPRVEPVRVADATEPVRPAGRRVPSVAAERDASDTDTTEKPSTRKSGTHGHADDTSDRGTKATHATRHEDGDDAAPSRRKGTRADDDSVASKGMKGRKADAEEGDARTARTKRGTADDRSAKSTRDEDARPAKGRRGDTGDRSTKGSDDEPTGHRSKTGRDTKDDGKAARAKESDRSRVYVQVAGGANRDDLGKAWSSVKKQAPDLMKGKSPSTTPLRATNRLLVGPFKDEDEAQAFVNKAAGKGVSGFVFKSTKGQKVDKIDDGK
jgi:Flp pilus assembly protein TadD